MKCPRCSEQLHTRKLHNVLVDECPKCKGLWFEEGELREAKDHTEPDLNWMDFEIWKHEDRFKLTPKALKCPKCHINMVAVDYDDTGVEVNHCSRCKGTWLDEGEFGKIVDALEKELTTKSASEYVTASLNEAKEIITGPENRISEWKDFLTVLRMFQYRFYVEHPKLIEAAIKLQKYTPIR